MRRAWWIRPPVVAGAAACGVAALGCAWAIAGAIRIASPNPASRPPVPSVQPSTLAATEQSAPADLRGAVDNDPFRADRRRPARRFVLPGTATPAPRVVAAQPRVSLTLTGTVVYPDGGGFALVRAAGRSPAMVRVGESIEGHTLQSVARDEATFVRPGGGSVVLRVPRAGG